jgi:hypothetical protein
MNLNFTRKIVEDDFERIFVRKLRELGVWAEIQVPAVPLRPVVGHETGTKPVFRSSSIFPKFLFSF